MKFLLVTRINCHVKDFSASPDMRRYKNWAHKSAPKNIYLETCPASFLGTQSALLLLSTLNSFRGCWRSAASVAHGLILVEVDGKQPWQCQLVADIPLPPPSSPLFPSEKWGRSHLMVCHVIQRTCIWLLRALELPVWGERTSCWVSWVMAILLICQSHLHPCHSPSGISGARRWCPGFTTGSSPVFPSY